MEKEGKKIVTEKPALPTVREFQRWAAKNSSPTSTVEKITEKIAVIIEDGVRNYPICEFEPTELGQAEAAATYLDGWFRFSPGTGWLVYDADEGRFHAACGKAALYHALRKLADQRWDLRSGQNREFLDFAKKVCTKPAIDHVAGLLAHDPRIWTDQQDFDRDPCLLNCKGETFDLRTGAHYPSLPEHLHTKTTAFRPEPGNPVAFFDFLGEITCKRPDLAEWIVRWFAYSLTGNMSAPFIANMWGGGKNGKSVLLNVMREIFGSYAMTISHSIVVENRHKSAAHDLAELPGVRLAIVPEVPPGRMATENVKVITGGDMISAERKYCDPFSFKPIVKLTLVSNHRLELRDVDAAMQRRIRLVPFEFTVPDGKEIPDLEKQLLKEGPQILSWLIQEAAIYLKTPGPAGFPQCETIDKATREYLDSEDVIQQFLDARTVREGEVKAAEMYSAFVLWAEAEGIKRPISQRMFGEKLITKGIERIRTNAGKVYCGVSLCA
jgi:putative DNA primase/helicase